MTRLVVGLGHPDAGDDAVGLAVAEAVALSAPKGVRVVHRADPTDLPDLWDGADVAVVVDAVRSGRPPGTLVVRDVTRAPLHAGWSVASTHALPLAAVVELARAVGRMPGRALLVGVEAGDATLGRGLSAAVRAAVDDAARVVLQSL